MRRWLPLPTCSVPAGDRRAARVGVAARQVRMPVPACVKLPLPLIDAAVTSARQLVENQRCRCQH